jgi:hypothetical protein
MSTKTPLTGSYGIYQTRPPSEHFLAKGMPPVLGVAYTLLDTVIQSRLDFCQDAFIFLHADPAGGPKLISFYADKCGMTRLWHEKKISAVREIVPGEYFAMRHDEAVKFCARFDAFRV